ncbi:MAG: hypothetical protein ACH350_02000 [Parachlamydiaceae bacterium]
MNNMNNIKDEYVSAVASFSFLPLEEIDSSSLSVDKTQLDQVIQEVAKKIISSSQLRPLISQMVGRDLSLLETTYLIVQHSDETLRLNTLDHIKLAKDKEQRILAHVVTKLSLNFDQLEPGLLNPLVLLLGINEIIKLAAEHIAPPSTMTREEEIEFHLNQLKESREKYNGIPLEQQNPVSREFLQKVDDVIDTFSNSSL